MGTESFGEFSHKVNSEMSKVRIDKDGTLRAPVQADGTNGIRFGTSSRRRVASPDGQAKRPGVLARIRAMLRR